MRLLIYGINYAPELTGIGKYTGEMCAWLANQGHDVSVITALPYYPEWTVHEKYSKKTWFIERLDGVNIYRCPLYVPQKVTSARRIIHEFSFLLSTVPMWLTIFLQPKYDVVICVSPPFHLGIFSLLYAKLRKSKLITHIQDLQIDAAKNLGLIKNNFLLQSMFKLEKKLLKSSSLVSTISLGMKRKIADKGIELSKIVLFPNWADETQIRPLSRDESLRKKFGIDDTSKVILYSGNLGEKQGLDIIVDVAKFYASDRNVIFIISGSGGGKENLVRLVNEAKLSNVRFFPLQPYERLSALLATADIHLVLQKKSASDLVMPSKLTTILSAGGCSIVTATAGTSLYDVVHEHKLGILVEPESVEALRNGIDYALKSDLGIYRINARKYTESFLSKDYVLRKFEESLV